MSAHDNQSVKRLTTDDDLRAFVERNFPEGGVVSMRTFPIPPKAAWYEIDGNRIPLRCWPGDLRVGIAVYDHNGKLDTVSAIEAHSGEREDHLQPDIQKCMTALIVSATAEGFAV